MNHCAPFVFLPALAMESTPAPSCLSARVELVGELVPGAARAPDAPPCPGSARAGRRTDREPEITRVKADAVVTGSARHPLAGLSDRVQLMVPVARPTKFLTVLGAPSSSSRIVMSPSEVLSRA